MTRLALHLALAAVLAGGAAPRAGAEDDVPLGWATMTEDGVIVLEMVRTGDGQPAHAQLRYAPGDPHYDEVLEHLGGLVPGESKRVMPFE
jgi:hypothetical protein